MSIKFLGKLAPQGRIRIKLPYVLPLAVGTVTTTAITATTATLSFVLTPNTSYEYSLNGTTWFALAADRIVTGLSGSTPYDIRVRAVNRYGAGTSSAPVSITTQSLGATFNPSRKGTGLLLTEGDLTVQSTSNSNWKSIVGTRSRTAGSNAKVYAEFKMYGVNNRIGLSDSRLNLEGAFTEQGFPAYYYGSGEYIINNSTYADGPDGVRNDIIMMAWSGSALFFGRNGVWNTYTPNVNPGMPTTSFFSGGTVVFPTVMILGNSIGERVTANFGPNFAYTPPAGYGPW